MKRNFSFEGDRERSKENSGRDVVMPLNVDQMASEEIRKIVQGLQGVQVGDTTLVQPVRKVPSLERQVKRAVEEMTNSSNGPVINHFPVSAGQGDVQTAVFPEPITAVVNVQYLQDSTSMKLEEPEQVPDKQNVQRGELQVQQQEVAMLRSTCFLHRVIKKEDAEEKQENILKVASSVMGISQEHVAAWEENEEKFIRTIEGGREVEQEKVEAFESSEVIEEPIDTPLWDDVPAGCIVEVEIQELDSEPATPKPSPILSLPPVPETNRQYSGIKKKWMSRGTLDKHSELPKMKIKTSLGSKIRKFFRSTFKGKDC